MAHQDEELAAACTAGFEIELGTRGIDSLPAALTRARACRSRVVRLVIDVAHDQPTVNETITRLRAPVTALAESGIRLAIENHDREPAAALVEIVETLGSDAVGVTLDTVNSFGALETPQAVITTLAPYVFSLHVKDFTVRRVASQLGFVIEGCAVGDGRLDVPWLLEQIRAAGRNPNAIIELWTPPATTLEETIALEAEWAERSVAYLRRLLPE
ncbi:MAG: sugar phosphate isomerase/epimerase family protein [Verrucomicrobiales bacterium]